MSDSEEQWRPIPGWEGRYEASDHGRVRSLTHLDRQGKTRNGCVLKPWVDHGGHLRVALRVDRRLYRFGVHRLVLMAFVRLPEPGELGRHLNDLPWDNRLENLAWGSYRDNSLDNVRNGGHSGANQTHCKNGHPFSGDNLKLYAKMRRGRMAQYRVCLACRAERDKPLVACHVCGTEMQRRWTQRHIRQQHPGVLEAAA